MCVKVENHLGLLTSPPQLLLYVFLHLSHAVLADPGDTCLLFSGVWDSFSPLANFAETTVRVTGHSSWDPEKELDTFWFLLSLNSLVSFLTWFPPLRCLQHQLKTFLGHSHLVCVLEVAGVFLLSWGSEIEMCVVGMMGNKEGRKSSLARPGAETFVLGIERQEKGKLEKWKKNQRRWEWKVLNLHEVFVWACYLGKWRLLASFLLESAPSSVRISEVGCQASASWEESHISVTAMDHVEKNQTGQKSGYQGPSWDDTPLTSGWKRVCNFEWKVLKSLQ